MRLFRVIKLFSVLLLSAVFIASAAGLTIYEHYCACTDDLRVTLIKPVHDCCSADTHQGHPKASDCESGCCQPSAKPQVSGHQHHNCCSDRVIRMKTGDFTLVQLKGLPDIQVADPLTYSLLITEPEINDGDYSLNNKTADDIKPPGKKLLIRTHQLRIPFHIA